MQIKESNYIMFLVSLPSQQLLWNSPDWPLSKNNCPSPRLGANTRINVERRYMRVGTVVQVDDEPSKCLNATLNTALDQDEWSGTSCQMCIINDLKCFFIQQSSIFKTGSEHFSNLSKVMNEGKEHYKCFARSNTINDICHMCNFFVKK